MKAAINRNIEHQVLKGGHPRLARDGWSPPAEELPLLDDESTRYPSKRKGKKRKAKERCAANPNGHVHEWMKDTEEVPVFKHEYIWDYDSFGRLRRTQVGTAEVLYRLCAHCGKLQYRRHGRWTDRDRGYREAWRSYNGRLRIF